MANGILQKLQLMPEKQKKAFLTQFAQWAQKNGLDVQQLSQDPQALEQAMTAFVQAIQGDLQPVTAKLGAKLNYIKSIKGDCPEGQKLVYFKEGGRVCKKCIEAAAGGEKVKDGKKEIADFKKKKACNGVKVKLMGGQMIRRPGSSMSPEALDVMKNGIKRPKQVTIKGVMTEKDGGKTPAKPKKEEPKKPEQRLDPRTTKTLPGGKYPTYWTSQERQTWERLHGDNDEGAAAVENKGVGKNKCGAKMKKHQQGGIIGFFQPGGLVKRFSVSTTGKNGTTRYFDTEEQAKAYQRTLPSGSSVRRDGGKEYQGQVLKVDRTKEASTAYARQKAEAPYNKLSFKEAYNLARKNGVRWFAYKGKVYKSDLEGKAAKNNLTEMQSIYGNNLGWSGDPKMKTKASQRARAQYRKEINTSEKGYTKEVKKSKAPYVSSYDGGELFANFMGLASPTRWVGAVGRASRGEGNTGTFVGKVLNNMLDPQNGARENQGIFSSGLSPADEQWAAEHPVISGVTNGALDAMAFGFRPRIDKATKLKPNYGYVGRKFATTKETVPMGIYEGDLNISPGTAMGRNPYVELGKQVGLTTKTITKKKMIEPGTRYVKSVSEVPTGDYNFSWGEGMKDMYPWVVANTFNRTMK